MIEQAIQGTTDYKAGAVQWLKRVFSHAKQVGDLGERDSLIALHNHTNAVLLASKGEYRAAFAMNEEALSAYGIGNNQCRSELGPETTEAATAWHTRVAGGGQARDEEAELAEWVAWAESIR